MFPRVQWGGVGGGAGVKCLLKRPEDRGYGRREESVCCQLSSFLLVLTRVQVFENRL